MILNWQQNGTKTQNIQTDEMKQRLPYKSTQPETNTIYIVMPTLCGTPIRGRLEPLPTMGNQEAKTNIAIGL